MATIRLYTDKVDLLCNKATVLTNYSNLILNEDGSVDGVSHYKNSRKGTSKILIFIRTCANNETTVRWEEYGGNLEDTKTVTANVSLVNEFVNYLKERKDIHITDDEVALFFGKRYCNI